MHDAVLYHLYVRSFADSDGDGIGDFKGVNAKLDYIKALGVDAILLLPIFEDEGPESGGYLPVDYFKASSAYGGDVAFDAMVAAAHQRGLKILVDLPMTLVGAGHPWFAAAKSTPQARNHFLVSPGPCPTTTSLVGTNGWYPFPDGACYFSNYAAAAPNVNYRDPDTVENAAKVVEAWLARGIDGFRLDSAASAVPVDPTNPPPKYVDNDPAALELWRVVQARAKAKNPNETSIAELFDHHPDYYARGVDAAFEISSWVAIDDGWQKKRKSDLVSVILSKQVAERTGGATGAFFLGNHDWPADVPQVEPRSAGRFADLLCPLPCTDPASLRYAAMLLLSLPGTPVLWMGDELGMHGAARPNANPRPWGRNPMVWDSTALHGFSTKQPWAPFSNDTISVASETAVGGSMLETYRALLALRKTVPALVHGDYREVVATAPELFAFVRTSGTSRVLVAYNFGDAAVSGTVALSALGVTSAKATELLFGTPLTEVTSANASAYPLGLAKNGALWIKLE